MKTFRVHLKNGTSFSVKAHHFAAKFSQGAHATVPFYKDENDVDENILVFVADVAAIVPATEVAYSGSRSVSGV